jgi:hypothetical protein
MKTVALVGFNKTTMKYHTKAPKGAEVWTVNHAWKYDIPKIDRLFEIHLPEHRLTSNIITKEHDVWLSKEHDFPIYTLPSTYEKIPSSVAYPYDEIVAEHCGNLLAGDKVQKVFTSSFDYMLALAIHEGFKNIYIYGFAMRGNSEYGYQRDGLAYWLGYANARGIKIIQHAKSTLLRPKVYHKGSQMISRQMAEHHIQTHEEQVKRLENQLAEKQGALGVLISLHQNKKVSDNVVQKAQTDYWQIAENLQIARGAVGAVKMLLDDHDTEGLNGDN